MPLRSPRRSPGSPGLFAETTRRVSRSPTSTTRWLQPFGLLRTARPDPQLAFDLTAETFVKAFEKRFAFRGSSEEQAAAWLFAIARNELAMYSRSNKAARAALERVGIAPHALADDDLRKVEELGATEEAREQVRAALDDLPPDQREVVDSVMSTN